MTTRSDTMVAILATTAGPELERTAAAFAAITSRLLIVDPLERVETGGVARCGAAEAPDALGSDSILAVLEGELPTAAFAHGLCAAERLPRGTARVVVRHLGRGWALEPRGGALRYGPWATERFGLRGGSRAAAPNTVARLPGALVAEHGDVDTALARLDAAAVALAALLDGAKVRVGPGIAAGAALGTTLRALLGRARGRPGWGRWIGAALLGYADVLAYTKVLERRGRP